MLVYLLHKLGVTPDAGSKTGAREAAWTLIAIALVLTAVSIYKGPETIHAMTGILATMWPSCIAAITFIYKLKGDHSQSNLPLGGADNQFHSEEGGFDDTRIG